MCASEWDLCCLSFLKSFFLLQNPLTVIFPNSVLGPKSLKLPFKSSNTFNSILFDSRYFFLELFPFFLALFKIVFQFYSNVTVSLSWYEGNEISTVILKQTLLSLINLISEFNVLPCFCPDNTDTLFSQRRSNTTLTWIFLLNNWMHFYRTLSLYC